MSHWHEYWQAKYRDEKDDKNCRKDLAKFSHEAHLPSFHDRNWGRLFLRQWGVEIAFTCLIRRHVVLKVGRFKKREDEDVRFHAL